MPELDVEMHPKALKVLLALAEYLAMDGPILHTRKGGDRELWITEKVKISWETIDHTERLAIESEQFDEMMRGFWQRVASGDDEDPVAPPQPKN